MVASGVSCALTSGPGAKFPISISSLTVSTKGVEGSCDTDVALGATAGGVMVTAIFCFLWYFLTSTLRVICRVNSRDRANTVIEENIAKIVEIPDNKI